jgi:hypothetical protein
MSLKNAAFLALIGTILTTILLLYDLVSAVINITGGLVPAMSILPLLIYSFASLSVAVFFFVFYKQS